jgi:hypothetical protein
MHVSLNHRAEHMLIFSIILIKLVINLIKFVIYMLELRDAMGICYSKNWHITYDNLWIDVRLIYITYKLRDMLDILINIQNFVFSPSNFFFLILVLQNISVLKNGPCCLLGLTEADVALWIFEELKTNFLIFTGTNIFIPLTFI